VAVPPSNKRSRRSLVPRKATTAWFGIGSGANAAARSPRLSRTIGAKKPRPQAAPPFAHPSEGRRGDVWPSALAVDRPSRDRRAGDSRTLGTEDLIRPSRCGSPPVSADSVPRRHLFPARICSRSARDPFVRSFPLLRAGFVDRLTVQIALDSEADPAGRGSGRCAGKERKLSPTRRRARAAQIISFARLEIR
jgi:hypothetical protein